MKNKANKSSSIKPVSKKRTIINTRINKMRNFEKNPTFVIFTTYVPEIFKTKPIQIEVRTLKYYSPALRLLGNLLSKNYTIKFEIRDRGTSIYEELYIYCKEEDKLNIIKEIKKNLNFIKKDDNRTIKEKIDLSKIDMYTTFGEISNKEIEFLAANRNIKIKPSR